MRSDGCGVIFNCSNEMKTLLLNIYRAYCKAWWTKKGCRFLGSALVHGVPFIKVRAGGVFEVGEGVTFNTDQWSNPHITAGAMSISVWQDAQLIIGARAGISASQIVATQRIEIGEDTLIGAGCLICDSDMHEVPLLSDRPIKAKPIRIGDRVFIGARCVILKGVTIGSGSVVGAGSVVSRDVPAGALVAGNPAQVVRMFNEVSV